MASLKGSLKIIESVLNDLVIVINPIVLNILIVGYTIPSSPIKDRDMEVFGTSITLTKPVYTGSELPMILFQF